MASSAWITYNGLTLKPENGYTITRFEENTPIRISEDLLTGQHGGVVWKTKYAMKTIAIEGEILGGDSSTYFILKNDLINAFSALAEEDTLDVTVWNGSSKSIDAWVITQPIIVEKSGYTTTNQYRIELRAGSPYWSGSSAITGSCGLAISGGTPVSSPVGSPVLVVGGNRITLNNTGDVENYATFEIRNACTNPSVLNITTGATFSYTGTLVDGDVLQIGRSSAGEYCLLNGSNVYSYFTGTVFPIIRGVNVLAFSASSYSATATLTTSLYEKFLSI